MTRPRHIRPAADGSIPDPAWKSGPPDEDEREPPMGSCPTCRADTMNGEMDEDEDGKRWVYSDCDDCVEATRKADHDED